ncbi:MAG: HAMP domain-containing protein [Candidatus Hodarchaeales archaeon]|jgi:HAMP domain-containing protein
MARSIKTNIILSFIGFALASLVIISVISIGSMALIGSTTTTESSNALKEQIKTNMLLSAEQNALVINQKLSNAESMVDALAQEVENLFSNSNLDIGGQQAYYDYFFEYTKSGASDLHQPDPNNTPENVTFDTDYGIFVSWTHASYYYPSSTPDNYLQRSADLNNTINTTVYLNSMFQYIYSNAPEFRWLYLAFADTGLFINYPGSVLGGTQAERIGPNIWDARNDEWYQDVVTRNIKFSAPYPDPIDGEPLITIGKTVQVGGKSILVAGDISIKDMKEKIVDVTFLQTGYGALITRDGTVVAHPEYSPQENTEEYPILSQIETNYPSGEALSEQELQIITDSQYSDIINYNRILRVNGSTITEERFLAFTPVSKGDYVTVIIVPVNEATSSVKLLSGRIDQTTNSNILFVLIIIVITAVSAIVVGLYMANRIIQPITYLTKTVSQITTHSINKTSKTQNIWDDLTLDLDDDIETREDEIGELTKAFKSLFTTLRQQSSSDPSSNVSMEIIDDEEDEDF